MRQISTTPRILLDVILAFLLAAPARAGAIPLAGCDDIVLLAAGTDGSTVARGSRAGLDAVGHLDDNDAYPFFEALGDLIVTGPTRTNVMGLFWFLVGAPP